MLAFVVGSCVAASAQVEGNPENWCRNGLYTSDAAGFRGGKVTGAKNARVYFHGDESDDCPAAGAKCRRKAYVVPGDALVVTRRLIGELLVVNDNLKGGGLNVTFNGIYRKKK